jgi:hypothetical protein
MYAVWRGEFNMLLMLERLVLGRRKMKAKVNKDPVCVWLTLIGQPPASLRLISILGASNVIRLMLTEIISFEQFADQ